jgi:hypothetical protein
MSGRADLHLVMACDLCGYHTEGPETLLWTTSVERDETRRICPPCSRQHVRDMEAKLDVSHWSA